MDWHKQRNSCNPDTRGMIGHALMACPSPYTAMAIPIAGARGGTICLGVMFMMDGINVLVNLLMDGIKVLANLLDDGIKVLVNLLLDGIKVLVHKQRHLH